MGLHFKRTWITKSTEMVRRLGFSLGETIGEEEINLAVFRVGRWAIFFWYFSFFIFAWVCMRQNHKIIKNKNIKFVLWVWLCECEIPMGMPQWFSIEGLSGASAHFCFSWSFRSYCETQLSLLPWILPSRSFLSSLFLFLFFHSRFSYCLCLVSVFFPHCFVSFILKSLSGHE